MAFISLSFASQYPATNNQLRTSSNLRNQATIQDGRVTVQTVQGRQNQGYAGSGARSNATVTRGNRTRGTNTASQAKVIHCYNCQEEGHMARQCTKPKRPKNSTWLKEKAMLAEDFESMMVLDDEQMAFLADNKDTAPSASAVLMAKLSSYDSATLSKVPTYDNYLDNHVIDQNEQEMQYYKQLDFNNNPDIVITSDSNMISYEQYLSKTENTVDKENKTRNESLTTELARYKEQIKLFEERQQFDLNDREKYIDGQLRKVIVEKNAKVTDFKNQIHSLKQQLNATVESHMTLSTTIDVLKTESKVKEDKYLDELIELEKQKKALDNHATLSVIDSEETLELAEESILKMHARQNDLIMQEKNNNIAPIDYVALNKLSEHFVKHFVPQKQLFVEHAFWLPISKPISEIPPVQPEPFLK
ncbi:retrovirus-related pol polyprotein from transposon TNT 1-94 [Tanacetum coccineum]|uniref:Retrovirus-related pol polyprotein from transposon TNT 1-94 n=1 Tax=Tanacetum coccineum TaxID=301880 RepID=A0ABQ4WU56_9ASTR